MRNFHYYVHRIVFRVITAKTVVIESTVQYFYIKNIIRFAGEPLQALKNDNKTLRRKKAEKLPVATILKRQYHANVLTLFFSSNDFSNPLIFLFEEFYAFVIDSLVYSPPRSRSKLDWKKTCLCKIHHGVNTHL